MGKIVSKFHHLQVNEYVKIIYSLYQKIDFSKMECLNESEEDSGKRVFRPWQSRLDKNSSDCVTSDCDAELLFNIPFTGNIKLKVSHIDYLGT